MSGCTGAAGPGIKALEQWGMRRWGVGSLGTYNCRNVAGSSSLSKHGLGQAWDAAVRHPSSVGDEIFAWCLAHAGQLGLIELIWGHKQWFGGAVTNRSASDHLDHVHIAVDKRHAWDQPLSAQILDQIAGGPPSSVAGGAGGAGAFAGGSGSASAPVGGSAPSGGPIAGVSALVRLAASLADRVTYVRLLKLLGGLALIVAGALVAAHDSLLDVVPALRKATA